MLGPVQGGIGAADERLRRFAQRRLRHRHAQAHGHHLVGTVQVRNGQRLDGMAHTLGQVQRPGRVVLGHQDDKLFAAIARRLIPGTPALLGQHPRDAAQAVITGQMPVAVVVQLEVVHIQHDQGQGLPGAHGPRPLVGQHLVKAAAVGHPGQAIGVRQLGQHLIGFFQLGRALGHLPRQLIGVIADLPRHVAERERQGLHLGNGAAGVVGGGPVPLPQAIGPLAEVHQRPRQALAEQPGHQHARGHEHQGHQQHIAQHTLAGGRKATLGHDHPNGQAGPIGQLIGPPVNQVTLAVDLAERSPPRLPQLMDGDSGSPDQDVVTGLRRDPLDPAVNESIHRLIGGRGQQLAIAFRQKSHPAQVPGDVGEQDLELRQGNICRHHANEALLLVDQGRRHADPHGVVVAGVVVNGVTVGRVPTRPVGCNRLLEPGPGTRVEMLIAAGQQLPPQMRIVHAVDVYLSSGSHARFQQTQPLVPTHRWATCRQVLPLCRPHGEEGQQGLLADLEHKVADDRIAVARLDRAGAKLVGAVSQHATRHLEKLHDLVVHARADLTGQILLEALGGADRRAIGKPALHPDRRQDHEQQGANDDELQPHTALTRWGGLGHGARSHHPTQIHREPRQTQRHQHAADADRPGLPCLRQHLRLGTGGNLPAPLRQRHLHVQAALPQQSGVSHKQLPACHGPRLEGDRIVKGQLRWVQASL